MESLKEKMSRLKRQKIDQNILCWFKDRRLIWHIIREKGGYCRRGKERGRKRFKLIDEIKEKDIKELEEGLG